MPKTIYREEDERFTEEANNFASEIRAAIEPIIMKWVNKGYKVRELSAEAGSVAFEIGLGFLLTNRR